jgi:quinol monooxygenase YgiN
MSVTVILELQVKPESVEPMKALLKQILPDTRAFDGCDFVDIYGNLDDQANLVFHERWTSREHYQRYFAWRAETGVVEQMSVHFAAPPVIRYFEVLDA